jgi:hypothetical protein
VTENSLDDLDLRRVDEGHHRHFRAASRTADKEPIRDRGADKGADKGHSILSGRVATVQIAVDRYDESNWDVHAGEGRGGGNGVRMRTRPHLPQAIGHWIARKSNRWGRSPRPQVELPRTWRTLR